MVRPLFIIAAVLSVFNAQVFCSPAANDTVHKELRARLIIDSFWTTYSTLQGWHSFTKYKIAAAEGFDTSVFGNAFYPEDRTPIENDTAGIIREYVAEKTGLSSSVPRDTVDCFVFQILRGDSVHNEWRISDSLGSFLTVTHAPFALATALRSFNAYINNNHVYRGDVPPAGDLKIGPVFRFTAGDPGWSLHAYHDTAFWYLVFGTGSVDCPCGCIEWRTDVYKIAGDGAVERVVSSVNNSGFGPIDGLVKRASAPTSVFSLLGRRVGDKNHMPKLGRGVYVAAKNESSSGNRIQVMEGVPK